MNDKNISEIRAVKRFILESLATSKPLSSRNLVEILRLLDDAELAVKSMNEYIATLE